MSYYKTTGLLFLILFSILCCNQKGVIELVHTWDRNKIDIERVILLIEDGKGGKQEIDMEMSYHTGVATAQKKVDIGAYRLKIYFKIPEISNMLSNNTYKKIIVKEDNIIGLRSSLSNSTEEILKFLEVRDENFNCL